MFCSSNVNKPYDVMPWAGEDTLKSMRCLSCEALILYNHHSVLLSISIACSHFLSSIVHVREHLSFIRQMIKSYDKLLWHKLNSVAGNIAATVLTCLSIGTTLWVAGNIAVTVLTYLSIGTTLWVAGNIAVTVLTCLSIGTTLWAMPYFYRSLNST